MKGELQNEQTQATEKVNGVQQFDFELWAKQVRPQLLASVQKRNAK